MDRNHLFSVLFKHEIKAYLLADQNGKILEFSSDFEDFLRQAGLKCTENLYTLFPELNQTIIKITYAQNFDFCKFLKLSNKDEFCFNFRYIQIEDLLVLYIRNYSDVELSLEQERYYKSQELLSKVAQVIFESPSIKILTNNLCETIVENTNYSFAWIGLKMGGTEKLVVPIANSKLNAEYLNDIIVKWDDSKQGNGPTGRAIKENQPITSVNIEQESQMRPWKAAARKRSFGSSIAIPLTRENNVIGALNIYSDQNQVFKRSEVAILTQLAKNLSYGMNQLRNNEINRRITDMLTYSEEKYRTLFNIAPISIITIKNSTIQMVNPKFVEVFGYTSAEELIGNDVSIIQAPSVVVELRKRGSRREQGLEEPNEYETIGMKKNGEEFPINVYADHFLSGNKPFTLGFIDDLTNKKEMISQLLEKDRQLSQKSKFEAIGRFAGNIAHDMNNILTGILGYSDLLRDMTEESAREFAEEIIFLGKRAKIKIEELQLLSRKEISKRKVININDLILSIYKSHAGAKEIEYILEIELYEKALLIHANKSRLKHVFENIISNAKEAIEPNGIIRIETDVIIISQTKSAQFDDISPDRYIRIRVTDNGSGIDTEIQKKIFDPYYTTKKNHSGVGLSVALGIVKQLNGHILFESNPGIGSVFTILFPLDSNIMLSTTDHEEIIPENIDKKPNLIIIDDEFDIMNLLKLYLKDYSDEMRLYTSSKQLVEDLSNWNDFKPDILITDIVMPNINGVELADRIREVFPEIKIIFISGYISEVSDVKITQYPNSIFLTKPFERNTLINGIRKLIC
ncbi:MAG: PAS domain S-box protein [Candidatus Heimdallarchaeota archaeon]|nr:PAS domain S-box protein [Candidatus Heimdallarchaeota archaeon]